MSPPEPFESDRVVHILANPLLALLGLLFMGLLPVGIAWLVAGGGPIVLALAVVGCLVLGVVTAYNPRLVKLPVHVRADEHGLDIGPVHVPRGRLKTGVVLPGVPSRVILTGLRIELELESTEDAHALLRALKLDVSQTAATFTTASRVVARWRLVVGALVGLLGLFFLGILVVLWSASDRLRALVIVPAAGAGLVAIGMLVLAAVPTKLTVGADGLVLRWLGIRRFISYRDIDRVVIDEGGWVRSRRVGTRVKLRSGKDLVLPSNDPSGADTVDLEARIREAVEAFGATGSAADTALLQRGRRTLSEWIPALRAIGAGANADMRTALVTRERLLSIVRSPVARAADRAAAAVALGSGLDAVDRTALQGATEAIAAPRLRVVLEAVRGDATDADLAAALAELEEAEASGVNGPPPTTATLGQAGGRRA
jgi:hypothetical protein